MSRLVDIDEVIKVAENTFPQEDVRKIMWVLCHTPTAYDISKVVAELEDKSMMVATSKKFYENPQNGEYVEEVITTKKAIDIVERGGVE